MPPFVDRVGLEHILPDLPVFLRADGYVPVPLAASYQTVFEAVSDAWRESLTTPDQ